MRAFAILVALASSSEAYVLRTVVRPAAHALAMGPATIDAPTVIPDALPTSWVVPDTFVLPSSTDDDPRLYKLTLFKTSNFETSLVARALMSVLPLDKEEARGKVCSCDRMGFALLGSWTREVAEGFAEELEQMQLKIDVSPES